MQLAKTPICKMSTFFEASVFSILGATLKNIKSM